MDTDIQYSNKGNLSDDMLNKLTVKELKVLAKQSNISQNFKKAELIQALRSSMMLTVVDTSSLITSGNVRRTRSRASMFPDSVNTTSATANLEKTENTTKKRGRKVLTEEIDSTTKQDILESFQIVSSIPSKPLEEITNNSKLNANKNQELSSINKNKKSKRNKKSTSNEEPNNFSSSNNKIEKSPQISDIDNCSDVESAELTNNSKSETEVLQENLTPLVTEEKQEQPEKRSRRGKRTNTTQIQLDNNVESKSKSLETSNSEKSSPTKPATGKDKKRKKRTNAKNKQLKEEKDISSNSQHTESDSAGTESLAIFEEGNKSQSSSDDKEVSFNSLRNKRNKTTVEKVQPTLAPTIPDSSKISELSVESDMPVPVPVRSSTFILDSPVNTNNDESSSKNNTFELPARSNTFTIDENVSEEQYSRRSLRFAPDPALQKESTTKQAAKKVEKSIGKRIFDNSKVHSITKSIKKFNAGSSVKKTITKNTTTPGSVFGKKTGSAAKKLPNFKSIHQRLFSNMESLGDNQKRKQERAQALLLSPAPRCAAPLQSPRNSLLKQTSSPTPLTRTENQMSTAKTPRTVSTKPSVTLTKPMKSEATAVNRFGFKSRVTKAEANTIAGKKLPPVTMQKTKEQDRKFLHGVRTNKRFMLQMQMRMSQSEN